jgi:tRNA dimethylallyltransferase
VAELRWVAIAGPTAGGKSGLAAEVAGRLGGEIINADSRQIYRYMDIGTAKPSAAERRRVPHHLYDLVNPDETFDVARYRSVARAVVREVAERRRLPVVVGGSGLYLRTLAGGLFFGPAADVRLRAALARLEETKPGTLHGWCRRLDPPTAARLHPHDTVRLIRALEVALRTGERISVRQSRHGFSERLGERLFLVLDPGRAELSERITRRSGAMFEGGLIDEVDQLWRMGYGPELRPMRSIGYLEAGTVLRGERSPAEALKDLIRSTRRFAKRQLTWFRGEAEVVWLHPDRDRERIFELVREFSRP